jgi:SAM-dependent methyltransferase
MQDHGMPERLHPDTKNWELGIQEHIQRYEFASKECRGRQVLDAACGVGYGSSFLFDYGASKVLGVDISSEAINTANRLYAKPDLSFQVGDCETLSGIMDGFDTIVGLECIEHFESPQKFLQRCNELLNKNGVLILSTPNVDILSVPEGAPRHKNPFHVYEFTYDELLDLLSMYFEDVNIQYQIKTPFLRLYEDVERFVQFEYKFNPFLRFGLWARRKLRRPGAEPTISLKRSEFQGYEISSSPEDKKLAWVFLATCRKPKKVTGNVIP